MHRSSTSSPAQSNNVPEELNAAALGAEGLEVSATIKDAQMAQWLGPFPGAISGGSSHIEHFLDNWMMMHELDEDTKVWVEGPVAPITAPITGVRPLTVTFNFENCGKVLFSSYHTEGREDECAIAPKVPGLLRRPFSPQDRILEYLIFDIANCIKPVE